MPARPRAQRRPLPSGLWGLPPILVTTPSTRWTRMPHWSGHMPQTLGIQTSSLPLTEAITPPPSPGLAIEGAKSSQKRGIFGGRGTPLSLARNQVDRRQGHCNTQACRQPLCLSTNDRFVVGGVPDPLGLEWDEKCRGD